MAKYVRRMFKRRGRKVPRGKKAIVAQALRKNWKGSVARVVKKVIAKQAEVKSIQTTNTLKPRNTLAPVSDLALYNVFMVSPNADYATITQGTGQSNRVGNQIRTKSCKGRIVFYPAPYNATSNPTPKPTIVRVFCVSPKDGYNSASEMATILDTTFFQNGNSSVGYGLDMTDLVRPVNKDVLTLHWTRTYKLGHSVGSGNGYGATNGVNDSNFSNNDYKQNYILRYDFTKHVQKTFKYSDTAVTPQGRATFLVITIYNADGTSMAAGTAPVDMYYQHDYAFTDM